MEEKKCSETLIGWASGGIQILMIELGLKLKLFEKLKEPISCSDLAKKAGVNERQLKEWLYSQTGYGLLKIDPLPNTSDEYLYSLKTEWSPVLFLPESGVPLESFSAGFVDVLIAYFLRKDAVEESMKTGNGITYDVGGRRSADGEKNFLLYTNKVQVPQIFDKLGWDEKLEKGAKMGDVGCGSGELLISFSSKYKNSEFHGFDTSIEALKAFREKLGGYSNIRTHLVGDDGLPEDESFDILTLIDVLHDLSDPVSVLKSAKKSLKPSGLLLTMDPLAKVSHQN